MKEEIQKTGQNEMSFWGHFDVLRWAIIRIGAVTAVFLAGYLFVSISRVTTSYFYATGKDLRAYLLIYGEPVLLALLLLFVPRLAGIFGTWVSVPLSQLLSMALGIGFLFINPDKK